MNPIRLLATALSLCVAALPVAAQDRPAAVTIGYLNLVNAQLVAKGLGLHEREMGVPVRYVRFGSGGDVNNAVAGGQIDFGGVGNPPASIGVTRGLPYHGILVLNMLGPVESLIVRDGIASLKDLVGKTVAVPFGSTTHYLMMTALKNDGIAPGAVKLIDLGPSDALAAWSRKDIDAAYVWEPAIGRMMESGGKRLLDSGTMAARGYPTWDVAVATDPFAAKYPALVEKFVKAECEAIDYWIANPAGAAEIVARELSMPVADATRIMAGTTMVPCKDQTGAAYLGTAAAPGQFADTLLATAGFLKEQNRLPAVKDRSAYAAFLAPQYLLAVTGAK
jgi:taurine transport system substrate-binding protein